MALGNLLRWGIPVVVFLVVWNFVLPKVGLSPTTSFIFAVMFSVGVVALVGKFFPMARLPIPILSQPVALIVLLGVPIVLGGAFGLVKELGFGGIGTPATIVTPAEVSSAVGADCAAQVKAVNPENYGIAATLYLNAWDLESDTPYSAAVDVTTVYLYKNGAAAEDYVTSITDTSAATVSGYAVGDEVKAFGDGTAYYTEPYNACIDKAAFDVNIKTHNAAATTQLQITGYDSTGSTTLSAGQTNVNDYNITLGASAKDTFYLKIKMNAADNAWNHKGWGIATFYNITDVKPETSDGRTYTKEATRLFLKDVSVGMDSGANNPITKSYVPYVLASPVLLREWEEIKDKFSIEASSSDPIVNINSTNFNGVALISLDAQYQKSTAGTMLLDFYAHTTAEGNAGVAETLTSPLGRDNGVLITAT